MTRYRSFKDTIVLVTGASSGIGRCVALDYAREGADVIVAARSEEKLNDLVRKIETLGRKAVALPTDLSIPGEAEKMIDRALDLFGRIDILVNNAGIGYTTAVFEIEMAKARGLFEINFWSLVAATKHLLPHMIRRGSGQIVNVSSIAGKRAFPGTSIYNASKFALQAFSESLRCELFRTGVDVVTVCPSTTRTAFFDGPNMKAYFARDRLDKFGAQTPEHVSKVLIRASKRARREVHLTLPGWLAVRLNPFVGGILDRVLDRIMGGKVRERIQALKAGEEPEKF